MKLVEVEWLDSIGEGRWTNVEEAIRIATKSYMLHRTAGYLVHENDDMILIAGSRNETGETVADTMQIPKVAVINVRNLTGLSG